MLYTLSHRPSLIDSAFPLRAFSISGSEERNEGSIVCVTITKDPCRSRPENVTSTGLYEADDWKNHSAETLFLGIPGSSIHLSCNCT